MSMAKPEPDTPQPGTVNAQAAFPISPFAVAAHSSQLDAAQCSERILIVAPLGRDAVLAAAVLAQAGIEAFPCDTIPALCQELARGAGALLITEEALQEEAAPLDELIAALAQQPPWSDLPVVLLMTGGQRATVRSEKILERLGPQANLTLLERPLHSRTMTRAAQTALRARRRQYEARNLLAQLAQGVRQRDEFLAMLGHELRNPLAAITYAIHLVAQDDISKAEARQTHAVITRQTRHLTRLVDDLLDVARVTQGKVQLQPQPVDLNEVAQKSRRTLETAIQAQQHKVTLTTAAPVMVTGDPLRLEQIVTNLLMNAIKYTPAGGCIEIEVSTQATEGVICIRDNGLGIAPELLPHVFDLFAQAAPALARTQGGLGIGLTLVQSLVALHEGTITAKSDGLGEGSEFVVRLPLLEPVHAPATRDQGPGETPAASAGLRILLIEDNADSREVLQLLLQLEGHAVTTAADGVAGLEQAFAHPPQVALVDIGLPGLDGYAVARELRQRFGEGICLLALTGYGQPDDRARTREAGFNRHLVKPVDIQLLTDTITEAALALRASS